MIDMVLTLSWWRSLSYRNQSINFLCKLTDWFLYDRDFRHERVNTPLNIMQDSHPLAFRANWEIERNKALTRNFLIRMNNRNNLSPLYHIETSLLIFSANQWTGFYVIETSVMKELNTPLNIMQDSHLLEYRANWEIEK